MEVTLHNPHIHKTIKPKHTGTAQNPHRIQRHYILCGSVRRPDKVCKCTQHSFHVCKKRYHKAEQGSGVNRCFDPATLLISKGGLQIPQAFTVTTASGVASASWTPPTATNFTDEAKGVVVVVDEDGGIVDVFEALASAGAASGSVALTAGNTYHAYMYFLDKRGSNKVASNSVHATGTVA